MELPIWRRAMQVALCALALAVSTRSPANAADIAYVALENAAAVVAIDLADGTVAARIPVGPLPRFTTASADGGTVAVINEGDQTISVIDTATNGVVETLTITDIVPPLPDGAYDYDDGTGGDDADTDGGEAGSDQTIEIPSGLASDGEIALSPDGATIYLAAMYFGVSAYDRKTGTVRSLAGAAGETGALAGNHGGILRLSADGEQIFVPGFEGYGIVNTTTMQMTGMVSGVETLPYPAGEVTSDRSRLLSAPHYLLTSTTARMVVKAADLETFAIETIELDLDRQENGLLLFRGMFHATDTGLGPDDKSFYTVRKFPYSQAAPMPLAPGTTPPLGVQQHELSVVDVESGAEIATAPLDDASAGIGIFPDGSMLAVVHPIANRIDIRDARTLEVLRSIEIGPTPRAGRAFIAAQGKTAAIAAPSADPAAVPADAPAIKF